MAETQNANAQGENFCLTLRSHSSWYGIKKHLFQKKKKSLVHICFLFMSKQIQYLSALHINKTYEGHSFVKLFKQFFF